MKKVFFSLMMVGLLALTACASSIAVGTTQPSFSDQVVTIVAATMQAIPSNTPVPTTQSTDESIVVAFVKDGDIHVWNSTTQQSELVFDADDANMVTISGDGQLIAFFRRWIDSNQCEQTALWVVERNGENAREIASPAELRDPANAVECVLPTITIDRIEWLPGTHRLIFSLIPDWEHTSPQGIYLANADMLSISVLIPADHSLQFVPSPDGNWVALMSTSGLSFINADGSDWRQDVVTYPKTGIPIPGYPIGVWTLDSRAFLLAAPGEGGQIITSVPMDGRASEPLVTIADTNRGSVTFSPDGEQVAFVDGSHRSTGQFDVPWAILPLGAGPLAIPASIESPANLRWSPANAPYIFLEGNLYPYCPNAAPDYDVCDTITPGYAFLNFIQWLDGDRFLFMTRNPFVLFLGRLDHTTVPVVVWPLEEWVTPQSFSAVLLTPNK